MKSEVRIKNQCFVCVLYISMTHLFYNFFFNVKISQEVFLISQYGRAKDNDKTKLLKKIVKIGGHKNSTNFSLANGHKT